MITIWHNPRCTKSRETLKLLRDRGLDPRVRRYLDDPPSAEELRAVHARLGVPAIAMMRPKEALFRELGLSKDDDPDRLIEAMAAHPGLIERPIVIAGARAALGRPPESVLSIL
ncbi:arsenate reductase (glutaredoxin) [Roseovarius salinarum]|uniref:arsenate reductase (glutaredoxin) n=1 Tax=Roseovarius salinarum TaxID=1981892 RepID=UPI001E5CBACE|nr:arsenate reductase (glutaredoxin) [Roseovarius salinarum]